MVYDSLQCYLRTTRLYMSYVCTYVYVTPTFFTGKLMFFLFSLNCFHGNLIVSGSNGKLYLFNWLGVCDQVGGALPVSALKMANDLLPHSTGTYSQWNTSAARPPL